MLKPQAASDMTREAAGNSPDAGTLSIGPVTLAFGSRQLRVDGQTVKVGGRAFDLLAALMRRRGQIVSADTLLAEVWPGRVVERNNLEVQLSTLRRMLGPGLLITVTGRGYCFAAGPVDDCGTVAAPAAEASAPTPFAARGASGLAPAPMLIGRESELATLDHRLRHEGLLSLCGPAGIGKSSLALAAAHRQAELGIWPAGVHWVALAPLSRTDAVVPTTAQALGIQLPGHRAPLDELLAALAPLRLLLILDNCEHLREAVASMVAPLRAEARQVHVLLTSQQRLALVGEAVLQVPPLTTPDSDDASGDTSTADAGRSSAVRLFIDRAGSHGVVIGRTPALVHTVGEICQQLDGLPLAIELAAARVPLLGVQGVRDRLADRLQLLRQPTDGAADGGNPKHSSLRAAFDWSHSLLSPQAQAVYRRLAVFAGGFTPALAQQVAADAHIDRWAVLDQLGSLLDKHLVHADGQEPPRLRLLDTAQSHALLCLAAAGEETALRQRHLQVTGRAFADAVRQRDQGELDEYRFADTLTVELTNAAAAMDFAVQQGDAEAAWGLADGAGATLFAVGRAQEALLQLQALQRLDPQVADDALRAAFWQRLARCGCNGRLPHAHCIELLERAARGFARCGHAERQHECRWMQAEALLDDEQTAVAREQLDAAQALERADWHPVYRVRRQRVEAMLRVATGGHAQALAVLSEAIATCADHQLHRWGLILRSDHSKLLLMLGRVAEAALGFARVVERASHDADRINRADAMIGLAVSDAERDLAAPALVHVRQAAALWLRSGLLLPRGASIAWVLARIGASGAAARWLGAVNRYHRQLGHAQREPRFDAALALLPPSEVGPGMADGESMAPQALLELLHARAPSAEVHSRQQWAKRVDSPLPLPAATSEDAVQGVDGAGHEGHA